MRSSWRCFDTGFLSGAVNMAIDSALLHDVQNGSGPVLRFYSWDKPAISFGYAQEPECEVDVERCHLEGIDLIRRPTGGRAVLHWDELTYSIVAPLDNETGIGKTIHKGCELIGKCLIAGLKRYGVDVELERGSPPQAPIKRPGRTKLPCFSSISRSEVKCNGRKLIGSAQRRFSGAMLQHGSIILGWEHELLIDLLLIEDFERVEWRRQLHRDSVTLKDCVGRNIDRSSLINCLRAGFAQVLDVSLHLEEVVQSDLDHAFACSDQWSLV